MLSGALKPRHLARQPDSARGKPRRGSSSGESRDLGVDVRIARRAAADADAGLSAGGPRFPGEPQSLVEQEGGLPPSWAQATRRVTLHPGLAEGAAFPGCQASLAEWGRPGPPALSVTLRLTRPPGLQRRGPCPRQNGRRRAPAGLISGWERTALLFATGPQLELLRGSSPGTTGGSLLRFLAVTFSSCLGICSWWGRDRALSAGTGAGPSWGQGPPGAPDAAATLK